jgi:hypothetical protein
MKARMGRVHVQSGPWWGETTWDPADSASVDAAQKWLWREISRQKQLDPTAYIQVQWWEDPK